MALTIGTGITVGCGITFSPAGAVAANYPYFNYVSMLLNAAFTTY